MKKQVTTLIVCALVALALMVGVLTVLDGRKPATLGRVLLITDNDRGWHHQQLRQGALDASQVLGAGFSAHTVTSPRMVSSLNWEDVAGVLVTSENRALTDSVRASADKAAVPVLTVAQNAEGRANLAMDEPAAMQMMLDRAAAAKHPLFLYSLNVGIVKERLEMVKASDQPFETHSLVNGMPKDLTVYDCLLTLDSSSQRQLIKEKLIGKPMPPAYGFDAGMAIEALETKTYDALLCEVPYALGYRATQLLLAEPQDRALIPYRQVTLDKLYEPQNIRLAFPLLED